MNRRFLVLPILLIPHAGLAQDHRSASFDRLTECRKVAAADERLACYDRAVDRLSAARGSGDLLVVDRATVIERRKRSFGLGAIGDMFGGGPEDKATVVEQLETSIRAVVPAKVYGRFDMQLANGTVWQTVDTLSFPPEAGAAIKVRIATLGGYRATVGKSSRSFLVKRLR